MDPLTEAFDERLQEIEAYLELLQALERQTAKGPPEIGGSPITVQQQRILYSSVYLQLYNLVEATANWCIEAVTAAAADKSRWKPGDLVEDLRREWTRSKARTHVTLSPGNRLQTAFEFCDGLIKALPVEKWSVERGGGGNWDDEAIEKITKRLGCELRISPNTKKAAKRRIRDDKNSLGLVKHLRNQLAHGNLSFTECGTGVTVNDLRDIKDRTVLYLREVVAAFRKYIDEYHFLDAAVRPARRS